MSPTKRKPTRKIKKRRSPSRRSKKKAIRQKRRTIVFLVAVLLVFIAIVKPEVYRTVYYSVRQIASAVSYRSPSQNTIVKTVKRTNANYGKEVDRYAREFGISAKYLKSLIILESSGRKNVPPRFEKHVYRRLKKLKAGQIKQFENLRPGHLKNASDEALKNMARSWGPFQVMGYKCILLGINIKDLRGEKTVYWGVKWIDMTYGDSLKKGRYKDAFHLHNTGKPYPKVGPPKTYNPNYVKNGLAYMQYF